MTWNHLSLTVLCLTFFVSKFHGFELNSLFITSVWRKMNIYSLSLITDIFHLGSFFWNCSDVNITLAKDATLVVNEMEPNYLPFETNLAFIAQVVFKWEQIKVKLSCLEKKILSWKWASSRNASFTSIYCCGQSIQLRPMKFGYKKCQT